MRSSGLALLAESSGKLMTASNVPTIRPHPDEARLEKSSSGHLP